MRDETGRCVANLLLRSWTNVMISSMVAFEADFIVISAGSLRGRPKTNSAGDSFRSSFTADLIPNRASGKEFNQLFWLRQRSESFSWR